MKKWRLAEAKKYLTEIIDDVLQGEVQAIVKSGSEVVYLIPGEKYTQIKDALNTVYHQVNATPISSEIRRQ